MNLVDITLHIYLEIIVEWVFEYSLLAFLLFLPVKRKEHFIVRGLLGLAALLAISFPLAIFYHFYGDNVFGRSFVYFTLFALSVVVQIFCFESDKPRIFLCVNIAYTAQNATYLVFISVYSILQHAIPGFGLEQWVYKLVYYTQFLGQVTLIYFLLIRKANKRLSTMPIPRSAIFMSAFTLLVSIFLTTVHDIGIQAAPQDGSTWLLAVRLGGYATLFLLDISVAVMLYVGTRFAALNKDVIELNHIIEQSAKQYEISQQTIDSINIKCHDMKHRINALVGGTLPEDTVKSISDEIRIYDSLIETGNKIIDVILSEKTLLCESRGIDFTRVVDGKAVEFMNSGDIACLLGNLLDNAIEAASEVEEKERRLINLSLQSVGEGIVSLTCANYFEGERTFDKGLPLTTKEDKNYHGFGMRSIQEIVSRYSGSLRVNAKDNLFEVDIVFYNLLRQEA